MTDMSYLFMIY